MIRYYCVCHRSESVDLLILSILYHDAGYNLVPSIKIKVECRQAVSVGSFKIDLENFAVILYKMNGLTSIMCHSNIWDCHVWTAATQIYLASRQKWQKKAAQCSAQVLNVNF